MIQPGMRITAEKHWTMKLRAVAGSLADLAQRLKDSHQILDGVYCDRRSEP